MCNLGEGILRKGISQGIDLSRKELLTRVMEIKQMSYIKASEYLCFSEEETEKYKIYFVNKQ